jgi:protein involved in polysaccharide export with SLBB domain
MPRSIRPLVCLALFVVSACSMPSSPDKRTLQYLNRHGFGNRYVGNAEEENYVSIGDTIAIVDVIHPEDLVSSQKVDIDGTVLLPELGVIHVAGYTRSDLRSVLTERYSSFYSETDIQVQIAAQGKKYFIFGEVRAEGEKKFPGDLTIFEAVWDAVPHPQAANLGRVRLIRPDPVDPLIITVNVNDMFDGDSTFNVLVQERDIIYVPPTMLASFAYFIGDLLFPVTEIIRELSSAIFFGQRSSGGFNTGRGRGNLNNSGALF